MSSQKENMEKNPQKGSQTQFPQGEEKSELKTRKAGSGMGDGSDRESDNMNAGPNQSGHVKDHDQKGHDDKGQMHRQEQHHQEQHNRK